MRTSYARLFADENGVSHFQDVDIELIPVSRRRLLSPCISPR